jgi:hypothetical protein
MRIGKEGDAVETGERFKQSVTEEQSAVSEIKRGIRTLRNLSINPKHGVNLFE